MCLSHAHSAAVKRVLKHQQQHVRQVVQRLRCIAKKCKSSTALYTDFKKDGTFLFDAIDAWNRRAGEDGKHETD